MSIVKLKGVTWDHPRGYEPLVEASKLYKEKKPLVEVSWEKRSLKNFGDQSLQGLANNFDLLIVDHPHSGVAASSKCVIPLDSYLTEDDFNILQKQSAGPSFNSYNYHGHQWALPIDAAMQCAAFRKDLLKSSIPTTWNEVLKIDKLGMALCPTDSLCSFLTLTAQFGSPIKEGNDYLVDEKIGVQVLELMLQLVKKSHSESLNWNPIQLFDYMTEENDIEYTPLAFCYTNYSRANYRKHQLVFTNVPMTKQAVLGGAGIAVSANCNSKQEAVDFAKWICSDSVQKTVYTEHQGQPANIEAWQDIYTNNLTNQFFYNTEATLKNAFVRPRFEAWPEFQEHLGDVVHEFLSKGTDSLKVIKYLNSKYNSIKY